MSRRIKRVNQLIREELGKIIRREGNFPKGLLVTLTRVETSPDLEKARVWVSVLPEDKISEVFKALDKRIYQFQQKLNEVLQMRPVPKIEFLIEKKTKKAARIEKLLDKVKEPDRD